MAKDDSSTTNISRQFRQRAGLPKRKGNKPSDVSKPSELTRPSEPKGGFGGNGETDVDDNLVDESYVEELEQGEEASAKSGQGATDGTDASTSTEATEAEMAAATKAPAKKTAAKK